MTMKSADPDHLQQGVITALGALDKFTEVLPLHGRFLIEDIDNKSFRAPTAFVSINSMSPKVVMPNKRIRIACKVAVMIITSSKSRNTPTASALSLHVLDCIHGNKFNLLNIGDPQEMKITPVMEGTDRRLKHALTAIEWTQDMTVHLGLMPAFEQVDVTQFKIDGKTYSNGKTVPDAPEGDAEATQ